MRKALAPGEDSVAEPGRNQLLEKTVPVAAVVNAITILRYLAGHAGQGVNAIARATNLSPSTCFGILKTLVGEEFEEFDSGSKHYRLGTAPRSAERRVGKVCVST